MLKIPNLLTLFRIALIPILVIIYFWPIKNQDIFITGLFVAAALTDWLDGYLARRWAATSALGTFLDPVADKLIISSALVLLVSDLTVLTKVINMTLFSIAVCIILGREIVISALREWMAELGERGVISVGISGKIKTIFQMVSIGFLLYGQPLYGLPIFRIGEVLFYIAALLTLWSMWAYLKIATPYLLEKHHRR